MATGFVIRLVLNILKWELGDILLAMDKITSAKLRLMKKMFGIQ